MRLVGFFATVEEDAEVKNGEKDEQEKDNESDYQDPYLNPEKWSVLGGLLLQGRCNGRH